MIQNSPEWLSFRKTRIGSSDVPIIMGISKYQKPFELFREKLGLIGPKKVNEFITGLGHKFEPSVRSYVSVKYDFDFEPTILIHSDYDFLMASLDGYDAAKNEMIEIKYVGAEKIAQAKKGIFDITHIAQVQYAMSLAGLSRVKYCCYTLEDYKFISDIYMTDILFNEHYLMTEVMPAVFKFYGCIQKGEWSV